MTVTFAQSETDSCPKVKKINCQSPKRLPVLKNKVSIFEQNEPQTLMTMWNLKVWLPSPWGTERPLMPFGGGGGDYDQGNYKNTTKFSKIKRKKEERQRENLKVKGHIHKKSAKITTKKVSEE
jgi:hypothetical protein